MKYDSGNDEWECADDERVTYRVMRLWFLDCAYKCCRNSIHYNNRWHEPALNHQIEYAWAYEQSESLYTPIEQLMLEVIALILYAGRAKMEIESAHRKKITDILSKNSLQSLLSKLPNHERQELEEDLKTLKVICSDNESKQER